MAQTLAEKILSRAAGYPVRAGDLAVVDIDFAMVQDINGPRVVEVLHELGADRVFDPRRVMFVFDHYSPEPTPLAAEVHHQMSEAAVRFGIPVREIGSGICHQLVVESGAARPGTVVVGTDSHSCTYGALASFGVSLGATEMAVALMSGRAWFKVPSAIRIDVTGVLPRGVAAKDAALALVHRLGEEGALYASLEFVGDGVAALAVADRLTIANLAVDCGAKAGLFPADGVTAAWLAERGLPAEDLAPWAPDPGADYERTIDLDLSALEPVVACPGAVDNVRPVRDVAGTPVTMVFIGTCTNGRIEDYREACEVLRGRRVAEGVRLLCYPASRDVQRQLIREGLMEVLVDAGATVMPSGCGPCAGLHGGVAGGNDVVVSTSARNYPGRMGSHQARIYLASPAVAATAAVLGHLGPPAGGDAARGNGR
ncbi:MAG: aconitase/3-isopropylmalate dehydratase large subunit family protein [Chloroflexota bacterium]|nr:aconitase/3-isopropylmalate dehydratase large subunit family protein [Chloroflexota bacterium]